jgi:LysM repeat protein
MQLFAVLLNVISHFFTLITRAIDYFYACLRYNGVMKKSFFLLIILSSLLLTAFVTRNSVRLNAPGAYDVIAAVNALRVSNGLTALEIDGSLMAAAQVQADYLASIGGPNITNGHQGAGGTYAYDRAAAAGYPLPQGVDVLECWAIANNSVSINSIITNYDIWGDPAHMDVMLHKYGKHVGAGVVEKDGSVYYILNVSTVWGVSTDNINGTPSVKTTSRSITTTPQVVPVIVSTPNPDGSISHVVESGQALWSIAIAYGVTVEQLRLMNGFAVNTNNIYVGETLKIRLGYTPTPSPTITPTPRQPTRTPVPPQAVETMQSVQPTTPTTPLPGGIDRTTIGLLLVLLCGIGLVLIIMGTLKRKK